MTGEVDAAGRALVRLRVRPDEVTPSTEIVAWIDTAFDGELVIPRTTIDDLGLHKTAAVSATLADGTMAVLETFHCLVEWLDSERVVEVIANNGRFPLVGIGLLRDQRLVIDYRTKMLTVE